MDWKKVDLEDRNTIESYFKLKKCGLSDFTFTNLFIWKNARDISYKIKDGSLIIKSQYPNEEPYIFTPFGSRELKKVILDLKDEFEKDGHKLQIKSISPSQKEELEKHFLELDIVENRDRFDYIYSIPELTELKGRKFHGKKNHLNRFFENYSFSYEPISSKNRGELQKVWLEWFSKIEDKAPYGLKMESIGIVELLKKYDHLNLKGGLLRVEGKIVAFSIAEALSEECVVVHIEKADTSYHGAYQAINQQFLKQEWSGFKYVNREEDLGIEGLRKAKLSYHPVTFGKKYEVVIS
jgi:hypothetical protein